MLCFEFILYSLCLVTLAYADSRSFTVDTERSIFLKDGKPFRYVSGSIHYFRVPHEYWDDRLKKLRASGANAVQTYIEWSWHAPEREERLYRFDGDHDIVKFIKLAQANDLLVILRPGPYVCADRGLGGFPFWLLAQDPGMELRTRDPRYMAEVKRWFHHLLPIIRPLLYHNGGPVISVQVENEYGSFGCDHEYMEALRDIFRMDLGPEVVLFTVDNPIDRTMTCGKTADVFATVDFGVDGDPEYAFSQQRRYDPQAPLVNSEFYTGWMDHWSEQHQTVRMEKVAKKLDKILSMNASVNMYMFHGGTNFGFTSGANGEVNTYQPQTTSYDYDAPVSEAGTLTEKYFAIRDVIGKYLPLPAIAIPADPVIAAYGKVDMSCFVEDVFDFVEELKICLTSDDPATFEEMGIMDGFLLYEHVIREQYSDPDLLSVGGLSDRAQVFVNKKLAGVLSREIRIYNMPIQTKIGDRLQILVENQGRINFGTEIGGRKGLTGNVMIGAAGPIKGWTTCYVPFLFDDVVNGNFMSQKECKKDDGSSRVPKLYRGRFTIDSHDVSDTFLRLHGWGKGVVFVNWFNLGRYWPVAGPQQTLYVPKYKLKGNGAENELLIFELESSPCPGRDTCFVEFVDKHVINGSVPNG